MDKEAPTFEELGLAELAGGGGLELGGGGGLAELTGGGLALLAGGGGGGLDGCREISQGRGEKMGTDSEGRRRGTFGGL